MSDITIETTGDTETPKIFSKYVVGAKANNYYKIIYLNRLFEVFQVKWLLEWFSQGYPHVVMEQANHNQINQNQAYIIDKVSEVLKILAQHSIESLYHG